MYASCIVYAIHVLLQLCILRKSHSTCCVGFTDAQECSVTMVRGSVKYKRGRKSTRLIFSSDGDSRVTFQCKLDNKRFEDCK